MDASALAPIGYTAGLVFLAGVAGWVLRDVYWRWRWRRWPRRPKGARR